MNKKVYYFLNAKAFYDFMLIADEKSFIASSPELINLKENDYQTKAVNLSEFKMSGSIEEYSTNSF